MPAERFYADAPLTPHHTVILRDLEFHHLKHVMRIQVGEDIEVVNGTGALAIAKVEKMAKDYASLAIMSVEIESKPNEEVILAQATPRSSRLDFILEKGTELGVSQFWLFPSFHSPRKAMTDHQIERMQALTIAAMKQCGRLYLPQIILKPPLLEWPPLSGQAFFGDVRPNAPRFLDAFQQSNKAFPLIFFIGPESGFTPEEVDQLDQRHIQGMKLHSHTLRAETAALVALSLIEAALQKKGDLNCP
jgi:16S rRNA (uracil1498-N3)-methyltransferase